MSTQHHLSSCTYRERLRELGLPSSEKRRQWGEVTCEGSEMTEPNSSQRGAVEGREVAREAATRCKVLFTMGEAGSRDASFPYSGTLRV